MITPISIHIVTPNWLQRDTFTFIDEILTQLLNIKVIAPLLGDVDLTYGHSPSSSTTGDRDIGYCSILIRSIMTPKGYYPRDTILGLVGDANMSFYGYFP